LLTQSTEVNVLIELLLVYGTAAGLRVGLLSLAPAGFASCGGYVVAVLLTKTSVGFPVSIATAVVGTLVIGALLALAVVRLVGVYTALATFSFLFVVQGLVSSLAITGGSLGILPIPASDILPQLILIVVINIALWYIVDHTFVGRKLDTIGANPVLAASSGINVPAWRLTALLYSAAAGALAGGFYARSFYELTPTSFGFSTAISITALAVIAGAGNWLTPLIVTCTVGLIPQLFNGLANWALIIQGTAMVLIVIVYPEGLSGLARRYTLPARALLVPAKTKAPVLGRVLAWL
jgi:branched-chain amino acid transport system permease protein